MVGYPSDSLASCNNYVPHVAEFQDIRATIVTFRRERVKGIVSVECASPCRLHRAALVQANS